MAKKDNQGSVNRKHLVGKAREDMYSRGLLILTGVILAIVIGLVGWGILQEKVIQPRTVVAIVEGKEIWGDEFISRVQVNRQQLVSNYLQNYQNYQLFAGNPGLQQQLLSQMSLVQFQLDPSQVGLTTINQLVDDELIILEAEKLGITVSDEEVERELQSFFSYFPDGTPTLAASPTFAATSTLSEEQYAIVSVTPTATAIPTSDFSTPVPSATITPTNDPNAAPTASSTPAPTATAFTQAAFDEIFAEYLDIQLRELGLSEDALRRLVKVNLYRDELFRSLTADMAAEEEQVWARHILVENEQTALDLLDQLADGAEWSELALEFSLDSSNADQGGDLNWFTFDAMVEPFAEAAFDLEIGEISQPVESSFGWHIVQALGHEVRPLSPDVFARAQNDVFQAFITELRNQYDWEIIEDKWFLITPDEPDIPLQYQLAQ